MTIEQVHEYAKENGYIQKSIYVDCRRNTAMIIHIKKRESDDMIIVDEFVMISTNHHGDTNNWEKIIIPKGVFKSLCKELFDIIITQ